MQKCCSQTNRDATSVTFCTESYLEALPFFCEVEGTTMLTSAMPCTIYGHISTQVEEEKLSVTAAICEGSMSLG